MCFFFVSAEIDWSVSMVRLNEVIVLVQIPDFIADKKHPEFISN